MEASELRIGNLIYQGDFILPVDLNTFKNIIEDPSNHKPIPLTEDWLLRFGFELKDSVNGGYTKVFNSSLKRSLYCSKRGVIALISELTKYEDFLLGSIEYVHQLQNLFYSITHEELKINELTT